MSFQDSDNKLFRILHHDKFNNIDDKLYLNLCIPSPTYDDTVRNEYSPGQYSVQYNQPIIDRPKDYYLAVVRFSIPTLYIPALVPEVVNPAVDPNKLVYRVSLAYNGQAVDKYVTWITPVPTSLPADDAYYFCYSYDYFLKLVNDAYASAFTDLGALTALPVGAEPPIFMLNKATGLFSFVCQAANYTTNLTVNDPTKICIYCNFPLLTLFSTFPDSALTTTGPLVNGRDIQFHVFNTGDNGWAKPGTAVTNPPTYLQMTQLSSSLANWTAVKSIQIISNSLPTVQEYVPSSNESNVMTGEAIIKDFIPITANNEIPTSSLTYTVTGPYELINLTGEVPISRLNLQFRWIDKRGRPHPIVIPYNMILCVKFAFIKKSTFTS